ncbi:hypothetical protein [Halorussus salinisoli]|uniref:hypothetical protein n=1 Tax=Halorussus salinisoli TaxID=2558242 RepID=UPI0010C1C3AD|nr:hypothetical protein [Halorussus salinisoli]
MNVSGRSSSGPPVGGGENLSTRFEGLLTDLASSLPLDDSAFRSERTDELPGDVASRDEQQLVGQLDALPVDVEFGLEQRLPD